MAPSAKFGRCWDAPWKLINDGVWCRPFTDLSGEQYVLLFFGEPGRYARCTRASFDQPSDEI